MDTYNQPVTLRLTANQANFLWAMMQSTIDASDDRSTVKLAKQIRKKLDLSVPLDSGKATNG